MNRLEMMEAFGEASKATRLDRLIGIFSPTRERDRRWARGQMAIMGTWNGGSRSRRAMSEFTPPTGSADADLLYDLGLMRDRSRALTRNTPLATGALNTVVTNVVGTGIKARPKVNATRLGWSTEEADAWQKLAREEWELWAGTPDCDLTRHLDLYGLSSLVFRSTLECGDAFTLLPFKKRPGNPYGLKVQLIEADRVCNPTGQRETDQFAGGVEMDADGAPVAYHVLKTHPGSIDPKAPEWTRIQAYTSRGTRRVLHHFDQRRIGQTRGYPYLAPVIEPLKQLGEYTDSEVMAAVISSMFSVFITTPDGEGLGNVGTGSPAAAGGSPDDASKVKLGHGAIVDLMPGEKIEIADPKRPNVAFDPFVQAILRQVGVALELPFEVLIKHFTASYTAARAALLEAWRFFKVRREWLIRSFLAPIYEAWMEEAVANGRLAAPGFFDDPLIRRAYLGCRWIGDAPGQIDPVKEVSAAGLRMEEHITSLEEETILMTGGDWEENLDQQGLELARLKAKGLLAEAAVPPVGINGKPNNQVPPGEEGQGTGSEPGSSPEDQDSDLENEGEPKK
jgi:lambda family phage portal protein